MRGWPARLAWVVGVVLAGCAGHDHAEAPPDELTLGRVQGEIRIGMSGAAVAEVLGSPNIVTTDEQRREVWIYDKVSTDRVSASASSYGTLIIVGGSRRRAESSTRQRTLTIVIKFDEDEQVRDFGYHYSQF